MRLPWLRLRSLRARLMVGILVPITLFIVINSALLYRQSLAAATTAYDRTLLASAKSIGGELQVRGYDGAAQLSPSVPYAALEAFEADNQSRMYYRVSALDGAMVSGFEDLPFWRGKLPLRPPYAALVDFYDARFRDPPVRMAVLLQPVASAEAGAWPSCRWPKRWSCAKRSPANCLSTPSSANASCWAWWHSRPFRSCSASRSRCGAWAKPSRRARPMTSRPSTRPTPRANCVRWSTPPRA